MLQAFLHRSTFQVAPIPHHEATAVAAPHHAPQAHADRTGAEDGKTLRFHAENLQNFMSSLVQWHRKIDKTSEAQGLVLRPFVWRNWVQTTQGVLCIDLHCPLEKRATRVLWPVRHGYIFLSWVVKSDPHCISSTFSAPVFWPSWRQMLDMSLSFSNCACAIQSCWGSSNAVGLFRWTEHRFHKFEPQVDRFWSSHLVGKKCWLYPASATRFRKNRSFKPAVNCRSRDCPAENSGQLMATVPWLLHSTPWGPSLGGNLNGNRRAWHQDTTGHNGRALGEQDMGISAEQQVRRVRRVRRVRLCLCLLLWEYPPRHKYVLKSISIISFYISWIDVPMSSYLDSIYYIYCDYYNPGPLNIMHTSEVSRGTKKDLGLWTVCTAAWPSWVIASRVSCGYGRMCIVVWIIHTYIRKSTDCNLLGWWKPWFHDSSPWINLVAKALVKILPALKRWFKSLNPKQSYFTLIVCDINVTFIWQYRMGPPR